MVNKINSICDSIVANNTDIFFITESWISQSKSTITDADINSSIHGYTTHHLPRPNRRGGGISIIARDKLKIKRNTTPDVRIA
jgi:hypothetical protein